MSLFGAPPTPLAPWRWSGRHARDCFCIDRRPHSSGLWIIGRLQRLSRRLHPRWDHERDVGERQRRHSFLSSYGILFDGTASAGEMEGRGRHHLISSPRCCGAGLPHHLCCARLWRRRGCALCNIGRHRKHCNVHVRDGAGGCVLGVGCSNSFLGVEMKSR